MDEKKAHNKDNKTLKIYKKRKLNINNDLSVIKRKKRDKKFIEFYGYKIGNKFIKSDFSKTFNESKNNAKIITNLLNEIYDKNIDKEEKEKLNRIIYKVVFDIRDSIELIDTNDKKIIKNKEDNLEKIDDKKNNSNENQLNQENNLINNFSNFNYKNDNQVAENYINNYVYPTYPPTIDNQIIHINDIERKESIYNNKANLNNLILPSQIDKINIESKNLVNLNQNNISERKNQNSLENHNYLNYNNKFKSQINNEHQNKIYYKINHLNNIGNINHIKVNNIFTLNNKNNRDFYIIENDLPKKIDNSNINKEKLNNYKKINFQVNEPTCPNEENININLYNKKSINKNRISSSDDKLKTKKFLEKENSKNNYSNIILKKENEININFNEKKKKESSEEKICKTEDIFINKSPSKSHNDKSGILNNHKKNLYSEQITRKYFTIINNHTNLNKNVKMEKILNREKTLKTSQKNVKKVNSKIKKNGNKKNHSKIPKKEPKINVQINLTDLKKQEILEKSNKNKATMQKDEKKDKIYYDYPEDLKYDVFGKQYKFSYKDK